MIPSPPINDCYLTCFSCWLAARRTPSSHLSSQFANSCTQISSPVARLDLLIQTLERTDHPTRHGRA